MSAFGFKAVEIPIKSSQIKSSQISQLNNQLSNQLINTDIRCSFKPKDGANLSAFSLNHLFAKKLGFNNIDKDIKALYPNIAFISVVFDQQQHYKTLKLYVANHSTNSQNYFKKVVANRVADSAGEKANDMVGDVTTKKCLLIFNIIKKYRLLSLYGLDLHIDSRQTLNKKIYLDTQELDLIRKDLTREDLDKKDLTKEDWNKEYLTKKYLSKEYLREQLLQDLDKKLLQSLPELMHSLNFKQAKQDKINNTIMHMKLNKLPLSTIGIDIDSNEIKLYFDYGQ